MELELYTKKELQCFRSPYKWEGSPIYTPITRIKVTCGGGMGGSVWYEYVFRGFDTIEIAGTEMLNLNRVIGGTSFTLNPRYIVAIEDFDLLTLHYSLDPKYWHDKPGVQTLYYIVHCGHKVELIPGRYKGV